MNRKHLLKELIASRFAGNQADFARAINRSPTYSKAGNVHPLQLNEPTGKNDIDEVVAMMRATDDRGRAMALGAVRAVLAGYAPAAKNQLN